MNIKLSAESVSALYEFAKKTNYLYLNDILKNDFNKEFIRELNGAFSEIYNQLENTMK